MEGPDAKCIKCHGGEKVKGKVDFSKIHTLEDVDAHFELWDTVAVVIEDGPVTRPWGNTYLWIRDPDGVRVALFEGPSE